MRISYRSTSVALLMVTSACASASISSIVAPESAGRTYHHILVLAPFGDIAMRRGIEGSFEAWNQDSGTRFIPAYRIFFPGRSFTASEVAQILRSNGIDATLLLEGRSTGTSASYLPPTYKLTCAQWMSGTGCATAPATPEAIESPWATFSARLFDAASGSVAWIATGTAGAGTFSNPGALYKAVAGRTVQQLAADHLAAPRTRTATDSAAAVRAAAEDSASRSVLGRPTP
jgi:hypothetical protein